MISDRAGSAAFLQGRRSGKGKNNVLFVGEGDLVLDVDEHREENTDRRLVPVCHGTFSPGSVSASGREAACDLPERGGEEGKGRAGVHGRAGDVERERLDFVLLHYTKSTRERRSAKRMDCVASRDNSQKVRKCNSRP